MPLRRNGVSDVPDHWGSERSGRAVSGAEVDYIVT